LAAIAEDFFELLCDAAGHRAEAVEAVLPIKSGDSPAIDGLLTALQTDIKPGSVVYLDLHSFPDLQDALTSGAVLISAAVRRAQASCIVAAPARPMERKDRSDHVVTLTDEEEESILVCRASFLGGEADPITAAQIREQLARSLWGEPFKRLRLLDEAIRSGTSRAKIIEYHQELATIDTQSETYEERLQHLIGLKPSPAESDYKRLHAAWSDRVTASLVEHALFVLTSFDQLTPSDFDQLMRALLHGRALTDRVQETEWIAVDVRPGQDERPGHKEPLLQERKREVDKDVFLEAAYGVCPDDLLALLDVRAQDTGQLGFEPAFKLPIARRLLRTRKSIFADGLLLEQAVKKSLVFDAPPHLAEQLADRYAEHISRLSASRQKSFMQYWMRHSVLHFIEERIPDFKVADEVEEPELRLLLKAIGEHVYARELYRAYAERCAMLLTRLLSNAATRDLVDQTLDRLMAEGQNAEGKHDLIIMFIRILRRHKEFSMLRWLKRILAEGNNDAKRNALDFLAGSIESGADEERAAIIDALCSWMPLGSHASALNNQTAALLAPRLAMHRVFDRRQDREHGKVDQLMPLFDLSRENGLAPESSAALKLLTAKTDGEWILIDLVILEKLIQARWGLEGLQTVHDGEPDQEEAHFEALCSVDETFADESLTEADARQIGFVVLLVEAVAVLLGEPQNPASDREKLLGNAITRIARGLTREGIYFAYRHAYEVSRQLAGHPSDKAQRRRECAVWLGNTLYALHASEGRPQ
jgi:hypothetical protein